ncbi:hypothetical protein MW887_000773 [Aspergillus wentii]|nr:hypothetical protein MW887_000773 [Aspergillus wentii]
MELTFHVSPDRRNLKRKCPRGACDSCRQRKRKCHHGDESRRLINDRKFIQYSPNARGSPLSPCSIPDSEPAEVPHNTPKPGQVDKTRNTAKPNSDSIPSRRFIGDLNPVALFVGDTSSRLLRGRTCQSDVGVWLDREGDILRNQEDISHGQPSDGNVHIEPSPRYRNRQTEPLLPPRQSQQALMNIYFQRIHPVLPLINQDDFQAQFRDQTASPQLVQAICLVAAKDHSAAPFLCLANHTNPLPLRKFTKLVYDNLTHTISMKVETRKITLIQVLALLSLHASGPEDSEDSTLHLSQAAHHAHTLGLHLIKYSPDQGEKDPAEKALVVLFWCLWKLDRWSAAINGRPLVIHDCDLGQRVGDVIAFFDAPFRVALSLASILGRVMGVYRPILDTPVDDNKPEIPRFEEVLNECNGWNLPLHLNLSLELAYHAIALLAARPWGLKDHPRSHTLYLRQDLSVYRIATLIQMCDINQFLPLPVVAYTLSMGFSISYKQLKRCQLPSTQHTAQQNLQTFYKSLKALSATWWSARLMTRLGQRAFDGINRMAENDVRQQIVPNSLNKNIVTAGPHPLDNIETANRGSYSHSDDTRVRQADDMEKENQPFPNINNQPAFDLTHMGDGTFTDLAADPMFEDIDNILGNFLDINIPNTFDNLFANDFLMGTDEAIDCAGLY